MVTTREVISITGLLEGTPSAGKSTVIHFTGIDAILLILSVLMLADFRDRDDNDSRDRRSDLDQSRRN